MANEQTDEYTPFFTPEVISVDQYLSGPVDFYRQTLGTGIQTTKTDDEEDTDKKEEDASPNIFVPIGADDERGRNMADMSTLSLGLEDPGDFKSFGVNDVNVNNLGSASSITGYKDAGIFTAQTGDLVESFTKDFTSNTDFIKEKVSSLSNFMDIDIGTGVQMDKPFGKGKTSITAPPVVGPFVGPVISGLAAFSGAANMSIQRQNAAIFKATGAGFIGEFKGAMVSRKPGSLIYSGNIDSKEAMAAREAVEKGFIPGTLKAETWDATTGRWSQATGQKPMLLQDGRDMKTAGGTYNPETGSFVSLDGSSSQMGTMESAQAMADKVDSLLGTTGLMNAEDVNTIRSQVDTNFFGTVTGKNFNERYTDEVVNRAVTATGLTSKQVRDVLDGKMTFDQAKIASTASGITSSRTDFSNLNPSVALGAPYQVGFARIEDADAYFSKEARDKRAADAKAEQARRDAEKARAAKDPASGGGDGNFGQATREQREGFSREGGPGGDFSGLKYGGRVGMQAGGEAGFVQRPEFVGGNETPTDGQSVADDKPREVPEGTFVINAAAVDFAGREDIEKMVREAYAKAGDLGQTGVSQEVDIAVSEGEVIIPPRIAKIIGYDRLNKINNRGKKEISRRQAEREKKAAKGGFISKKK